MKLTTATLSGFLFCSLVVAHSQESSEPETNPDQTTSPVTNSVTETAESPSKGDINPSAEPAGTNSLERIPFEQEFSATIDVDDLQIPEGIEPRYRIEGDATVIEGGLVPVFKEPTGNSFFQMFNPFAPKEYGGTHHPPGTKAPSRAFHDPVKSKPTWVLFSVGAKPEAVKKQDRSESPD